MVFLGESFNDCAAAEMIEKSLLELDFASLTRRTFTPSPAAWEDQVLYFLLLDRFSDGKERDGYRDNEDRPVETGTTPLYQPGDSGRVDYDTWLSAGNGWQGGTLAGLKSKLGYLRRLGITALWVSPIFRQVAFEPSYHGYGIQNFLDVDPHFGTRDGVPRLRPGRPRARDLRHSRHYRPPHRQRFHLRCGSPPDARPRFRSVLQRSPLGRQPVRGQGLQRP